VNTLFKLAGACALAAITTFFAVLTLSLHEVNRVTVQAEATLRSLSATSAAVQRTIEQLRPAVAEMKPTMTDVRRTILIASGTLNLARDTLRNEQATIRAANQQTIDTMKNVDQLVANVDQSQQQIARHADAALALIEPVMTQTRADLAALEPVVSAAKPVLDNTAATMANADRISADLAKVTDDAVRPKPWYKRVAGYIWVPVKLATIFAK
jgi:ABC-type transporter Mla subunit MlaD